MKRVCQICGRNIRPNTREYACNVAVIGAIMIRGHPVCVDNLESLVVIPNRFRVEAVTRDPQQEE